MTRYVLLRIGNDEQAETLIRDMAEYPESDLLTPSQENFVHATIDRVWWTDGLIDDIARSYREFQEIGRRAAEDDNTEQEV